MVESRTVWFLALYGLLASFTLMAGGFFFVRGVTKERRAVAVIQRADSLMNDWIARGCAPRSKTLP